LGLVWCRAAFGLGVLGWFVSVFDGFRGDVRRGLARVWGAGGLRGSARACMLGCMSWR